MHVSLPSRRVTSVLSFALISQCTMEAFTVPLTLIKTPTFQAYKHANTTGRTKKDKGFFKIPQPKNLIGRKRLQHEAPS